MDPTGEELKRIMLTNGGTYHHYYSRAQTTHIIASNLPNSKIQSLNTDFIVNPKWITDSLAAEKLLDYKKYLLYTNQSREQPKLKFQKVDVENESKSLPQVDQFDSVIESRVKDDDIFVESEKKSDSSGIVKGVGVDQKTENVSSKRNVSNTSNPNFLSDFYNNSRLHHISTSGAMFKEYVKDLQSKEDNFSGRTYLKNWMMERGLAKEVEATSGSMKRVIMHIDMDCFFVSVGLIKHPELVNQPVAVTHANKNSLPNRDEQNFKQELNHFKRKFALDSDKDLDKENDSNSDENSSHSVDNESSNNLKPPVPVFNLIDGKCSMSEIASCSYEARKKGVKNGMFLGVALKLCPELKTISYDFEGYKSVSMDLYDTVASYTKKIEALSCDEMFVDLEDILKDCDVSPLDFASCIREQIQVKTQCPCSAGLGPNMITARLATKKAKPNGQIFLQPADVKDFMKSQPASDLPGVGWSLTQRLESEGVKTCFDLQRPSLSHLQSTFGHRTGKSLYDFCRGVDERTVNREHQRKSVSAEINYGIRFQDWNEAEKFLLELSEEVAKRLANVGLKGRSVTLKLKVRAKDAPVETAKFMGHGICDNVAKTLTLGTATDHKDKVFRASLSLLKQVETHPKELRGVGIQVSKLEPGASCSSSIKSYFSNPKTSSSKSVSGISNESHPGISNQSLPGISNQSLPGISNAKNKSLIVDNEHFEDSNSCDSLFGDRESGHYFRERSERKRESGGAVSEVSMKGRGCERTSRNCEVATKGRRSCEGEVKNSYKGKKNQKDSSKGSLKDFLVESDSRNDFRKDSRNDSRKDSRNDSHKEIDGVDPPKKCFEDTSKRLDPAVLAALPPDLREQVIKEYQSQGYTVDYQECQSQGYVDCKVPSKGPTGHSQEPGPSKLTYFRPELLENEEEGGGCEEGGGGGREEEEEEEKGIEDMSFSQIDASFLDALPLDVREDLKREFQRRKVPRGTGGKSAEPATMALKPLDPTLQAVKRKRGRPSGSGRGRGREEGKGRGRGRGRGRRIKSSPVKSAAALQRKNSPQNNPPLLQDDRAGLQVKKNTKQESGFDVPVTPSGSEVEGPTLCGQYQLSSIKALISDWIATCETPEEIDVRILTDFCTDLVEGKDLEKLELVLKFLRRRSSSASVGWKGSFARILNGVQQKVVAAYSAPLRFSSRRHR